MPVTVQQIGRPTDGRTIGQWVKEATIRAAEAALREEVARGFDNEPVVVTDRMPRRDYNQVKPFGRIEFHRRAQLADVVLWTLDELRKISPVLTGFYVSSHEPLLNGKPIGGNVREALLKMQRGDMVMIVNTAVYAAKIEGKDAYSRWETRGGKRSRRNERKARGWTTTMMRGQSGDAKGGVYKKVLFKIKARFGNLVAADFRPQQLPGGVMVRGKLGGGSKRSGARAQVYPTMILRLFDA
jgi:hypothetical protein